jgi:hypothetical protein
MTINFKTNNIAENSDEFFTLIRETILNLEPNKSVKFKTEKGVFGVLFNKKQGYFSTTLDGYSVEELPTAEAALEAILGLYKAS